MHKTKKIGLLLLAGTVVFSIFCTALPLSANQNSTAQAEPSFGARYEISDQFISAKGQAENLWKAFQTNREFNLFQPGKTDQALTEEFEDLHKTRTFMWTTAGYERAEHLIAADLIRAPGCVAFAYNNTVPYYNASTISLGNKYYIACEGPRSKDIPAFFKLLATQHVTHLVRLTGSYEAWAQKCHPYWDGFITESNGNAYLNVPTDQGVCSIQTFHMDHWRDNHGVDPEELLALALQIRDGFKKDNGLLAVHCSAGVGRTGTFIAALAIVDAIDRGQPFSIEEIVYRLSLQRVHSVAKFGQYITLHRLAESYLKQKASTR
ncbi:MAG: dual specificity protein phosphatase family protein [Chlamydiia bacterium]|nr:dual specificity protein phosphatase family protein [Chlamydiia bacterium]